MTEQEQRGMGEEDYDTAMQGENPNDGVKTNQGDEPLERDPRARERMEKEAQENEADPMHAPE